MRRTITEPADVSTDALAELKSWLGITRPNEDALLEDLLRTSIDTCEAYTGQAALSQLIEERIPTDRRHAVLVSRPVTSLVAVEVVAQDGSRNALDPSDFEFSINSTGEASIMLNASVDGQAIAVLVRAGIAATWANVPAALKQGLIRLAAYYYRDRDVTGAGAAANAPPASVSALWRPWRLVRLT